MEKVELSNSVCYLILMRNKDKTANTSVIVLILLATVNIGIILLQVILQCTVFKYLNKICRYRINDLFIFYIPVILTYVCIF